MGLRFRKSVTICKGVRLNFSKTGASITLGQRGYHKTISTSGRVTTSIGIPGTGIYYTDTKQLWGNHQRNTTSSHDESNTDWRGAGRDLTDTLSNTDVSRGLDVRSANGENVQNGTIQTFSDGNRVTSTGSLSEESEPIFSYQLIDRPKQEWDRDRYEQAQRVDYEEAFDNDFFMDDIVKVRKPDNIPVGAGKRGRVYTLPSQLISIYSFCDAPIQWKKILHGESADELHMFVEVWEFCKSISKNIIDGDIEAYLEAIAELAPVEDLLLYAENFEFGTDDAKYIEAEYHINPEGVLENNPSEQMLKDYVEAVSLRVARDLAALLPVDKVIIQTVFNDKDVMSAVYDTRTLESLDYCEKTINEITEQFNSKIDLKNGVNRIEWA